MNEVENIGTFNETNERNIVHKLLGELLITVPNKYFKSQEINIDGYRLINCYLEKCIIYIRRGTFEIFNCKLDSCNLIFSEEALKTVQLFMLSARSKTKYQIGLTT